MHNLGHQFEECRNLAGFSASDSPDLSNITNLSGTFYGATSFNQDIGSWDASNVLDMGSMFWNARDFNRDISGGDTHKVTVMSNMFREASSFNQKLRRNGNDWDTSAVESMARMFYCTLGLEDWGDDLLTDCNKNEMFYGCAIDQEDRPSWY